MDLNLINENLGYDQWFELEVADRYDTVCSICDNGGNLLGCDGKCPRSFHATAEDGIESMCDSLGYSADQIVGLWSQPFVCQNCKYKRHQCFGCGKLGSSVQSTAEVFQCVCRACNYFYHPQCAAKWLYFRIGDQAKELEKEIAAGKPFICPRHVCFACKRLETKHTDDVQMHFAVCRRCPRAYHRKCLPRDISFEGNGNVGIMPRAWEGFMHNQILMYCSDHEIDNGLGTPMRNHLRFPH